MPKPGGQASIGWPRALWVLGQYFVRKFIGNLPHSEKQQLEANSVTPASEDSNLQMCFGTLECKDIAREKAD